MPNSVREKLVFNCWVIQTLNALGLLEGYNVSLGSALLYICIVRNHLSNPQEISLLIMA